MLFVFDDNDNYYYYLICSRRTDRGGFGYLGRVRRVDEIRPVVVHVVHVGGDDDGRSELQTRKKKKIDVIIGMLFQGLFFSKRTARSYSMR